MTTPLATKAARLQKQADARKARMIERQKASRQKQARDYGRPRGSSETWPQFKLRIRTRDRQRCIVPTCTTARLGLEVHHRRSVGSGQKNDERECVTLCAYCHSHWHEGDAAARAAVERYLAGLYPTTPTDEELDAMALGQPSLLANEEHHLAAEFSAEEQRLNEQWAAEDKPTA